VTNLGDRRLCRKGAIYLKNTLVTCGRSSLDD
jgi:hypothetical protein